MIVDAHTHLGSDLYAGHKTGPGDLAAADRYVQILHQNGVDKGFAFTMAGLFGDPKAGNDDLARARDRHPDIIIPWGTVDPYWNERKLRREMRRCIRNLGFAGFTFHPWTQGFSLTDPGIEVVAEECIEMNVPLTSHDGTAFNCTALQLVYYARAHPRLVGKGSHAKARREAVSPKSAGRAGGSGPADAPARRGRMWKTGPLGTRRNSLRKEAYIPSGKRREPNNPPPAAARRHPGTFLGSNRSTKV